MRLRLPLLALALLCCAAAPAFAEDELPPTSQFFDEYDTNMDGKVMADEFRGSGEVFRLLDKNKDGAISPDELGLPADYKPDPSAAKKRRARARAGTAGADGMDARRAKQLENFRKRLMAMDANQDQRVSKDEWKGPEQAFDRIDRNKDGFIDAKDAPQGKPGGRGKKARKGGADGNPEKAARVKQMKERAERHFASLDKNADGKLTADESPRPELVQMADADKDGSVTFQEFWKFMQSRARQRGGQDAKGKGGDRRKKRGRISGGMLRRWDRDQDGKVSAEEFPGNDEAFARLDADKDGYLTQEDIKAARAKRDARPDKAPTTPRKTGNVIEQNDTDGDGKLTRNEFPGTNSVWKLLDRNGDGWITADELK